MKDSIMHIQYKGRFASLDLQKKKMIFKNCILYLCMSQYLH